MAAASADSGPTADERKLFQLLNEEREKIGLPRLEWSERLAQAARAQARLLAEHKSLSHQFPDEAELMTRLGATGLRFDVAAENIGRADSVEMIHGGLMYSPPHRANILNTRYNAAGVGIVARDGMLWAAQDFAHVLPNYTEAQFRDAVVAAFNKLRRDKKIAPIAVQSSDPLRSAACVGNAETQIAYPVLGAAKLQTFTSSVPEELPPKTVAAVLDPGLRRVSLAVCFRPGPVYGYGSFTVVAAFYSIN